MPNLTPKQAIELAKEKKATYVDLKFMDFVGLWQHFSIPLYELTEAVFEEGLGFDGSSIRGWQAIHASDMLVMPDASTAAIDPFMAEPTLSLICNVSRPDHEGAVLARPAQHRHQGREVPEVHRHRRHGVLRPGAGVLHLRRGPLRLGA
ncbi:MAG: glutamine synthetase [Anaeromyxobacteraceae bacterium]